jgi:iron complex outermembrane recepter protein
MRQASRVMAVLGAAVPALALAQSPPPPPPESELPVETIVVTPLPGSGIDRDKVPANVMSLGPKDLGPVGGAGLTGALERRAGSISLNDEQGTPFQPDVEFRGFDASPIFGTPQGLAIYQSGVRINEAFGDTVNWDTVPDFAVHRLTAVSSNPVFGLNALGGAITLEMKNGFNSPGTEIELTGGSWGRAELVAQSGMRVGNLASYIGIAALSDHGYRQHQEGRIDKIYADLSGEKDGLIVHLNFTGADNFINAAGPTPIQLLEEARSSVFTLPQSMHNELGMVALQASYTANDFVSLDSNLYYRHFAQRLVDGNTSDVEVCSNPAELCLGSPTNVLFGTNGKPIPNFLNGAVPGIIDKTATDTDGVGSTLQGTITSPLWDHGNHFIAGLALDRATTHYQAVSELAVLEPGLLFVPTGFIIDQPDQTLSPVDLTANNTYWGLYATDTFDVTDKLSLTASARFNLAFLDLIDHNGTALAGNHRYDHFNPGIGATYKIIPEVTGYASWSMANRIPTAGELACSSPAHPCALDEFLVADPNLKQVIAETVEAGLRGSFAAKSVDAQATWNLGVFRTDSRDDIINAASALVSGLGFFQNAGETRRQGIEAGLTLTGARWSAFANYSLVDATFQSTFLLSSPNNPFANANGAILVHPGDHLPLIPENRFRIGGDYKITDKWSIGATLSIASGIYLAGDESNQNGKIPGFQTVQLRTSYAVTENVEVFGRIDNLFNDHYATFGTFTDVGPVTPTLNITNATSLAPALPFSVYGGVRIRF